MSKLKKLFTKPHIFFRDMLLKRYPVNFRGIEVDEKNPFSNAGGDLPIEVAKCNFPIDIVYTWVDSTDDEFVKELSKYIDVDNSVDRTAKSPARWKNHDELKYSLRSIDRFAKWVNRIYVVTNGQKPSWLKESAKLKVVSHADIIDGKYLPTFNSHVIGSALHRIPGLSEHYIYFNDDIFLLKDVSPEDFFTPNGLAYSFISNNEIDSGPPSMYDIPTVVAAKNTRDLIKRDYQYYFRRRMAHMYHPQRKSVSAYCEAAFDAEYDSFRVNKFRHASDLLCASYLHPYVGYLDGKVLFKSVRGWYVKIREQSALKSYKLILEEIRNGRGRPVLCANDYIPKDFNFNDYDEHFFSFLESAFPWVSQYETTEIDKDHK